MRSTSSRIAWKTRRLAEVAREVSEISGERLEGLCRQVLAIPADAGQARYGRSALNNDGVPLQLCFSASRRGAGLRLIGDPGTHLAGEERFRCSVEALREVLRSHAVGSLEDLAETSLEMIVPSSPEGRSHYRDGFLWLAVGAEHPGVALYLEAAPLGREAGWEAADRWLAAVLPAADPARQAIRRLRQLCVPASMGLEGSGPADLRAKVYFRLRQPMALSELGLELLQAPEIDRFLTSAMADFGVDLEGLLVSLGFAVASGELADLKIDLCGHCLTYSPEGWLRLVEDLRREFALRPFPLRQALETGDCEVAFIGFGLDQRRQPRLNLYLKGADLEGSPRRDELEAAVEDSIRYLCDLQHAEGCWTDFRLPVGVSDQWVTAYVALALARAGQALDQPLAVAAAREGADWLTRARTYHEGWGYNGVTGPDADSTAVTLALLRELGYPLRREDQRFLRQQWRPEGGVATYSGPNAWGCAHWDVTPWGYLGMTAEDREDLRQAFLDALSENRMPGGMWRSYWWRNPYYSTFVTLETLRRIGVPEPAAGERTAATVEVDNPFDLACMIGVLALRGAPPEKVGRHLRTLLSWQEQSGRWPGHANLRVTDDTCYEPWVAPAGDYYADEEGTITSATALCVLALVLGNGRSTDYRNH